MGGKPAVDNVVLQLSVAKGDVGKSAAFSVGWAWVVAQSPNNKNTKITLINPPFLLNQYCLKRKPRPLYLIN
jgi:hypothetical protein